MYKNYLKIAFRSLIKNKLHTSINIFGLSIGFVVAILSILYIKNELSYEKWIPNQEEIYRVYRQAPAQSSRGWAYTPSPLAATLSNEIAGIKQATKLYLEEEVLFTKEEKSIYIKNVAFVDSTFFNLFPFPFKEGDANTALDDKNSVVISERIANLLFGYSNPIGEILKYDGATDYLITGILKTNQGNTFLNHEVFLSIENKVPNQWLANRVTTYVRKEKKADIDQISEQTNEFLFPIFKKERQAANMPIETIADLPKWKFQPLSEIHLHSDKVAGFRDSGGAVNKLYLFGLIAFIVLLIASINYMNLATAKASSRAKEVGIRKVTGAKKSQLMGQFLTESTLQSILALGIAIVLAGLFLPIFNQITNRNLNLLGGNLQVMIFPLLLLSILIGLLAGIYPAFFLTQFKPIKVLKGNLLRTTSEGQFFRKALVVTQFSMSVILIIIVIFINKQVHFMQSQELGFDDHQVMTIATNKRDSWKKMEQRSNSFESINGVKSIAFSNNLPGKENSKYGIEIVGKEIKQSPDILFTSENFDKSLGLVVKEGRFFSTDYATDKQEAYIVNEKFVKEYDIKSPIGQEVKLMRDDHFGRIIGVVKDFHFTGLQDEINPMMMTARRNLANYNYVIFKLASTHLPATIAAIKKEWAKIEPTHPVRYSFLDEKFAAQYEENEKFGYTMTSATILAIFIAMMGLFGLASFMTEQRTKEIGVRKVLGASILNLTNLLVKDFIQLVLIAGFIAVPFGYLLVKKWLEGYAYTTTINAMPFILAIIAVLALAILTVSYQSIKVSTENPIKALKVD
jgi:putative ABC transport system permease protein